MIVVFWELLPIEKIEIAKPCFLNSLIILFLNVDSIVLYSTLLSADSFYFKIKSLIIYGISINWSDKIN